MDVCSLRAPALGIKHQEEGWAGGAGFEASRLLLFRAGKGQKQEHPGLPV